MTLSEDEKLHIEKLVYSVEYQVFENYLLRFLEDLAKVDNFDFEKDTTHIAAQAIGAKYVKDKFVEFIRDLKGFIEERKVRDNTYE